MTGCRGSERDPPPCTHGEPPCSPSCPSGTPHPPQPPGTFADGAAQLLGVHLVGTVEGLAQDGVADHRALLGATGTGLVRGGTTDGCHPQLALPPSPYLAAADGALLVIVGCPAGAVRPVLPLEEAGVGVLLQLLQVLGLGALGELSLPRSQAGPSCVAPVGDVHLDMKQKCWHHRGTPCPVPMPGCPPWPELVEEAPTTTGHTTAGCWDRAILCPPACPHPALGSVTGWRPRAAVPYPGGHLPVPASPRWGGLWC